MVNEPDKVRVVEPALVATVHTNIEGIPGEDMHIEALESPVKEEQNDFNLESEIEIEEDMIFKSESSDLSEFIQEINKEDMKDNQVYAEDGVIVTLVKKKDIDEDIIVKNEVFSEYDKHAIVKTELKHELKQEYDEHAFVKNVLKHDYF